ncbi:DUT1 [[Candida] subhashii]|uniref:Deoxyuridine 5'-triphosphate nucleotidohydrolase n=1 Tax=[Candida] subhashii TaxID=561895 RepID=A0A8J5UVS0_9ASCO|nr:DUT1 [[Candida] subhashii]KAG7662420.1 DUT1 [[Candida] subhashii]
MTTEMEQIIKKQKLASTALKVFLRSPAAKLPTKGSALAAGYDLYASQPGLIPAKGQGLIATDISIIVPEGTYGRVAPRSGLAVKNGISTGAGVIDADYRGEVKVVLFNHSDKDFEVKAGDRIAQLVLEVIVNADIVEIDADELDTTERGAGGFGSTGKN